MIRTRILKVSIALNIIEPLTGVIQLTTSNSAYILPEQNQPIAIILHTQRASIGGAVTGCGERHPT
jgi:hypothetical protein